VLSRPASASTRDQNAPGPARNGAKVQIAPELADPAALAVTPPPALVPAPAAESVPLPPVSPAPSPLAPPEAQEPALTAPVSAAAAPRPSMPEWAPAPSRDSLPAALPLKSRRGLADLSLFTHVLAGVALGLAVVVAYSLYYGLPLP
jgi:hypothetical protein